MGEERGPTVGLFDVAMGSYDGAKICELVGILALSQLPEQYDRCDIGLYRDDGLAVLRGVSGSMADHIKKDNTKPFTQLGLRITIQTNIRSVNFLDVTFNLRNGKYYPYRKPNDKPLYISRLSNHPPQILRQLTAAISRCLTDISYGADVFREAAPLYKNALRDSGFMHDIEYVESRKAKDPAVKKNHVRRITWFNPPYSKNVKTRVDHEFLKLIDKNFPAGSRFHKVFNRNTIKVSYSCLLGLSKLCLFFGK